VPVGTRAGGLVAEVGEHRDEASDSLWIGSDVNSRVDVIGHSVGSSAVLEAMQQHHLASDDRPRQITGGDREVSESSPDVNEGSGHCRQPDGLSIKLGPGAHTATPSW